MACGGQLVEGNAGNRIAIPADIAIGPAAVVPLPAIPAGTRRVTVQATHTTLNTFVRVRPVGGVIGSGAKLGPLAAISFGGGDGGLAALEVEGDAANPTTVAVIFEGSG